MCQDIYLKNKDLGRTRWVAKYNHVHRYYYDMYNGIDMVVLHSNGGVLVTDRKDLEEVSVWEYLKALPKRKWNNVKYTWIYFKHNWKYKVTLNPKRLYKSWRTSRSLAQLNYEI